MSLRRLSVASLRLRRFLSSNSNHDVARTIAELNKEMELIFGEPPANGPSNSLSNGFMAQESQLEPQKRVNNEPDLTHIGNTGKAQMVDVSPCTFEYKYMLVLYIYSYMIFTISTFKF